MAEHAAGLSALGTGGGGNGGGGSGRAEAREIVKKKQRRPRRRGPPWRATMMEGEPVTVFKRQLRRLS